MARLTGLEPATPGVTGRYSNQLSYNRSLPHQVYAPKREPWFMLSRLPRQAYNKPLLKVFSRARDSLIFTTRL